MPEQTIDDWNRFFREASKKSDLLAEKYPRIPKETLEAMEAIDPAGGKSLEWMARQLNSNTIRWPEDSNRLKQALDSFWQIKKSPRTLAQYSANPDLSTYTMQTLEVLDDQVRGVLEKPESLTSIPEGTNKVYDDGDISVIQAATPEAACDLARGTKWCTSDPKMAEDYIKNKGGLYIWFKSGKKFAQSSGEGILLDLRDREVPAGRHLTGIYYKIHRTIPSGITEEFPEAEPVIAQNAGASFMYAQKAIKGKWPPGEKILASHAHFALQYARQVLEAPFPEGEPGIANDSMKAFYYAKDAVKGRWPPGERALLADTTWGTEYSARVLKRRWPELEAALLKEGGRLVPYAAKTIKGRWPEAEPIILKSPTLAKYYARDVIKGRWPEAEPLIFSNSVIAKDYVGFLKFIGIPDPREQAAVDKAFAT